MKFPTKLEIAIIGLGIAIILSSTIIMIVVVDADKKLNCEAMNGKCLKNNK